MWQNIEEFRNTNGCYLVTQFSSNPTNRFILSELSFFEKVTEKKNTRFIYEAAFKTNDVFAVLDILAYENGNYIAYEVKSTDYINDIYLTDAALQYYVINEHVPLKDIFLVYLNKEYIEELNTPLKDLTLKNCDIHKLFVKKSPPNSRF